MKTPEGLEPDTEEVELGEVECSEDKKQVQKEQRKKLDIAVILHTEGRKRKREEAKSNIGEKFSRKENERKDCLYMSVRRCESNIYL